MQISETNLGALNSVACTIYFGGRWEKTAYTIIILFYSHNKVMRVYVIFDCWKAHDTNIALSHQMK